MHRLWRAAGRVLLGGFVTVLMFGNVAILGAILGQRASMRPAAPADTAAAASADAAPGDAAGGAGDDDVPAEDSPAEAGLDIPAPTVAEVLAARFPVTVSSRPFSIAMVIPGRQPDDDRSFDPDALSGMAPEPQWPGVETPQTAVGTVPADLEVQKPETPTAAVRRSSARSPYVLNDAMILSIKRRLRLTAEQEKLWLPVEAALRKLVFSKAALNPQRGQGPVPYIDPASSGDLKTAAMPLIARLNEGQKREVKDIVHVMGLTAVASQF